MTIMKLKKGDLFTIEISEDEFCIGQILQHTKKDIYIVVFEGVYKKPITEKNIEFVKENKPAILARTGDTFFNLKRWVIVANKDPQDRNDYYPNYKIETLDGVFVTTFDRQPIRKASKDEEDFYQFYNYKSPAYVVSAIKAYHGLIPMDDDYKKMTFKFVSKRANSLN